MLGITLGRGWCRVIRAALCQRMAASVVQGWKQSPAPMVSIFPGVMDAQNSGIGRGAEELYIPRPLLGTERCCRKCLQSSSQQETHPLKLDGARYTSGCNRASSSHARGTSGGFSYF